jgi:hypothetical protein
MRLMRRIVTTEGISPIFHFDDVTLETRGVHEVDLAFSRRSMALVLHPPVVVSIVISQFMLY